MMSGVKHSYKKIDWHEVKVTIWLFIWLGIMIVIPLLVF
jgi:hypothetical protein